MRKIVGLLVLAGLVTLTACGPSHPDPLPAEDRPAFNAAVEYPDGEPSGEFEDDPAVQVAREYEVLAGAARNSLNFTEPELRELYGPKDDPGALPFFVARDLREGVGVATVGPRPFEVIRINLVNDTHVIDTCMSANWLTPEHPEPIKWFLGRYEIRETDGEFSLRRTAFVDAAEGQPGQVPCTPSMPQPIGMYVTQPDVTYLEAASPADLLLPPDANITEEGLWGKQE